MGLNSGSVAVRTQSGLRTEVRANGHALVADEPAFLVGTVPASLLSDRR